MMLTPFCDRRSCPRSSRSRWRQRPRKSRTNCCLHDIHPIPSHRRRSEEREERLKKLKEKATEVVKPAVPIASSLPVAKPVVAPVVAPVVPAEAIKKPSPVRINVLLMSCHSIDRRRKLQCPRQPPLSLHRPRHRSQHPALRRRCEWPSHAAPLTRPQQARLRRLQLQEQERRLREAIEAKKAAQNSTTASSTIATLTSLASKPAPSAIPKLAPSNGQSTGAWRCVMMEVLSESVCSGQDAAQECVWRACHRATGHAHQGRRGLVRHFRLLQQRRGGRCAIASSAPPR